MKGRLKDGRTIEEARAQIETIYARLRCDYPNTNKDVTASVVPASGVRFHPMLDGYFRAASAGLFAAVGARAADRVRQRGRPAAGARASARRREFAMRAAIGAAAAG